MAQTTVRATYPWGRASPGMRLRTTVDRAQKGLEQATTPGLAELRDRWTEAVGAAQPLVDTLDHLSRRGFRAKRDRNPVSGVEISKATRAVHDALGEFVDSTLLNVSERYTSFAARC